MAGRRVSWRDLSDKMARSMHRARLQGAWDFPWARGPGIGSFVTRGARLGCIGWALADEGVPAIEVHLDGGLYERVSPSHYREDIHIAFGHSFARAGEMTGWACALDVRSWRPGPHELSIRLRADEIEIPLGTRQIEVPDSLPDLDAHWSELLPLLRSPRTRQPLARDGQSVVDGNGATYPIREHQVFLSSVPGAWVRQATSAWGLSPYAREVIRHSAGHVLAIGAGIGPTASRLIQLDIVDFPNVDVIADGDSLPFADEAFDAVICENVIEHVPDPFALVGEIDRVLKPGGQLGLNGTNLHFTHGYPSHYFNATEFGMRHLLETRSRFEGRYDFLTVPESLDTVLQFFAKALAPDARRKLERLTVRELLAPSEEVKQLLSGVPDQVRRALSTNIYFAGRKKQT